MTEYQPKRRRNDSFRHKAYLFFRRFFTLLGVMVFISALFFGYTIYKQAQLYAPKPIQDNTILTFTFEGALPETLSIQTPTDLFKHQTRIHDVTKALKKAAKDDRVAGFIARIQSNEVNLAQVQELRSALDEFKSAGKFTHIFSEDFGGGTGSGMRDYYLASAFENIWLQPIGSVGITGLSGQIPFFKGTLDKLGLEAELYTREDYKTFAEPMTREMPSKANIEMTNRLLGNIYDQMVNDISASRDFQPDYLKALIDRAPLFDTQALETNLVTHIDYLDVMVDHAKEQAGGEDNAKLVGLETYLSRLNVGTQQEPGLVDTLTGQESDMPDITESPANESEIAALEGEADDSAEAEQADADSTQLPASEAGSDRVDLEPESDEAPAEEKNYGNRIALVYANGAIMPTRRRAGADLQVIGGEPVMSAEDISITLSDVRKDDRVGIVVLRLDSPGGSPSASETIARAITRLREAGKPVIVSMGSAAASGGYWIATHADYIVANPATMTGSIGVVAGKIVTQDLMNKIGMNIAEFNFGANADMWSSATPFSARGEEKMNMMLDHIYNAFLMRVSEGRNIPIETLRSEIAGGRVWTGAEGIKIGLVDQLGDLDTAIEHARSTLDLKDGDVAHVVQYPPERTKFQLILKLMQEGAFYTNPVSAILDYANATAQNAHGVQTMSHLPRF